VNLTVALVGLLVGTFIGISGVGGSSLMTPMLILLLRIHPVLAVGTDLVYSVPTKLLGTAVHGRNRTIDRKLVIRLLVGGIPGALAGLAVAAYGRRHFSLLALDSLVRHAVGVALIVSAVVLVVGIFARRNTLRRAQGEGDETVAAGSDIDWTRATHVKVAALGFFVGCAVSITSIGSGAITLPVLYAVLPRLGLRRLVGSDIAFATFLLPVAAVGNFLLGNVDLHLAANLLIGSLPGVVLGSYLCRRLPETLLRPAVAGILIFAGSRLV
jgi:uncharacterized membrane protein YfcA